MNYAVFGKTIKNVRKNRNVKLVVTNKKRNYLVSEPNYHTTKWFSEGLLAIEMKKIKVKMNKLVYLGLSILEISKSLMHEFWYDYIKGKYQQNTKLCYMDTGSFIIHIKTEDVYEDITDDVEKRFDTSNYEADCNSTEVPFPIRKNKKVIGLMKEELVGKITIGFVSLRPKTWMMVIVIKKQKIQKRVLKFNGYKNYLLNNQIILKSQQRFKST